MVWKESSGVSWELPLSPFHPHRLAPEQFKVNVVTKSCITCVMHPAYVPDMILGFHLQSTCRRCDHCILSKLQQLRGDGKSFYLDVFTERLWCTDSNVVRSWDTQSCWAHKCAGKHFVAKISNETGTVWLYLFFYHMLCPLHWNPAWYFLLLSVPFRRLPECRRTIKMYFTSLRAGPFQAVCEHCNETRPISFDYEVFFK